MTKTLAAAFSLALAAIGVSAFGAADSAQYSFERSTQGWGVDPATAGKVSLSTAKHFAGSSSLAIVVGGAKVNRVGAPKPAIPAGKTVTFHIWVPATGVKIVQPYVQDGGFAWHGSWTQMSHLKGNAWNTIVVKVPPKVKTPQFRMGVEVTGDGKSSPTVYVDSVAW